MPIPTLTGAYLIDLTNDNLAGYQNGVDSRALLSFLNMAKDEVWSVIKELHDEYFQVFSQNTNPSGDFYFPQLSTAIREYTLPEDLRSIEYIELLDPMYCGVKFTYCKLNNPAFRAARQAANSSGGPNPPNNENEDFLYTIAGKDQFVLASYPPANLNISLWYTRALPDFEAGDELGEIVFPFTKKLAEYAAKRVMLADQDPGQFSQWAKEWRDSLINLVQAAGERNDADPQFAEDFSGDSF
jgi:hypothetical protein